MRKFLAVVKREYLKLVWTRTFVIGTLLAPLIMAGFALVPALLLSIEGNALRVGILDQSGKLGEAVKSELSSERQRRQQVERRAREAGDVAGQLNTSQEERLRQSGEAMRARFAPEIIDFDGRPSDQVRSELNAQLRGDKLDAYIIIPPDFETQSVEFYARNTSDFVGQNRVERALNEAVRRVRMQASSFSQDKLDAINRPVSFNVVRVSEVGETEDNGNSFLVVFIIGLMIYVTLSIYGQAILAAVVEEKETRIAETLFSSARPFTLMMGKLVGVGLVALTQLGIWVLSAAVIVVYGAVQLAASGISFGLPNLTPSFVIVLLVFFLLGFFTYATVYALIGSMVTTVQEGGQLALLPVMLQLAGFYAVFPVIRNPNSDFAFWASVLPFTSSIVMPVRMSTQAPPVWQILLAVTLAALTIIALTWLAARVYRIGMLMYGKKATIPEVWRWIRQA